MEKLKTFIFLLRNIPVGWYSLAIALAALILGIINALMDFRRRRPRVRVSAHGAELRFDDGTSAHIPPYVRVVNTGLVDVCVEKVTLELKRHPALDIFEQRLDKITGSELLKPAQVRVFPFSDTTLAEACHYNPLKIAVKLTTETEFHTKRLRELAYWLRRWKNHIPTIGNK